jgi:hypothetical protein
MVTLAGTAGGGSTGTAAAGAAAAAGGSAWAAAASAAAAAGAAAAGAAAVAGAAAAADMMRPATRLARPRQRSISFSPVALHRVGVEAHKEDVVCTTLQLAADGLAQGGQEGAGWSVISASAAWSYVCSKTATAAGALLLPVRQSGRAGLAGQGKQGRASRAGQAGQGKQGRV